jgi:hypothetical protein
MNYILCLGIKSTIYKKNPILRLSINEYFIDEFTVDAESNLNENEVVDNPVPEFISQDLDKNVYSKEYSSYMDNFTFLDPIERKKRIPKNYDGIINNDINVRYFEISENILKSRDNKIILDILNDDNNYTNGFLTKGTFLTLSVLYLAPKEIFTHPEKFLAQHITKELKIKNSCENKESIKLFYKKRKVVFNLIRQCNQIGTYFFTKSDGKITKQIEPNYWIGESGRLSLIFHRDFIQYPVDNEIVSIDHHLFVGLSNKYRSYENNRSNC